MIEVELGIKGRKDPELEALLGKAKTLQQPKHLET